MVCWRVSSFISTIYCPVGLRGSVEGVRFVITLLQPAQTSSKLAKRSFSVARIMRPQTGKRVRRCKGVLGNAVEHTLPVNTDAADGGLTVGNGFNGALDWRRFLPFQHPFSFM